MLNRWQTCGIMQSNAGACCAVPFLKVTVDLDCQTEISMIRAQVSDTYCLDSDRAHRKTVPSARSGTTTSLVCTQAGA